MTAIGEYDVTLERTDDGLFIRFYGMDRDRLKVLAFNELRMMVAVKIPGRHVYSGQGQPWTYSGISYEVLQLASWPLDDQTRTTARKLLGWGHWQAQQA